jgi:hypothetical protein
LNVSLLVQFISFSFLVYFSFIHRLDIPICLPILAPTKFISKNSKQFINMKKLLIPIAFSMLTSLALTSCKKDYNCTCTDSIAGTTVVSIPNSKKSDAQDACDVLSSGEQLIGGSCSLD